MRGAVVARKSLEDFSQPRFLAAFLVPFVGITALLGAGFANGAPDDLATLPLHRQEQFLVDAFAQLSFLWGAGIPVMILAAVLAANALAREEEDGSLRILLSKPIRRRDVLLGKFAAIFAFSVVAMIAGLSLTGTVVFVFSGASPTAVGGSVLALMPGNVLYAIFTSFVVAAVGTAVASYTGNRLRTGLGVTAVPALLFGFVLVRMVTTQADLYGTYLLYVVDVNYHFGNAYVFLHGLAGTEFTPTTQASLAFTTGAFDTSGGGVDPLLGGVPGSLPLAGYVPPAASFALLLVAAVGALAGAVYHFERKDVG